MEQFPSDYIFWTLYIEISNLCNTMYVKKFLFFICVRKCNWDYFSIKTMYVKCIITLFSTFVKYMLTEKKTIRPKLCVGTHMTPAKVYEALIYQNLCPIVFIFVKFWKCTKIIFHLQTFLLLFSIVQLEKILTDKATIKNWTRRWARSALKALFVQY